MPFRTKQSYCRSCKHPIDAHSSTDGKTHIPSENDISICAYCGEISLFDEDQNLVPLTKEQLEELQEDEVYPYLETISNMIKNKNK